MTAEVGEDGTGLIKVPEVAKRLNVSIPTVWRLVGSGELDSIKVGRSRRIDPEEVEAYKKRSSKSQSQRGAA